MAQSTLAGYTIRDLHDRARTGSGSIDGLCARLSYDGVPKGTISKIRTVLTALKDGRLQPTDVTSLNSAYQLALDTVKPRVGDLESLKSAIEKLHLDKDQLWDLYGHVENLGGF